MNLPTEPTELFAQLPLEDELRLIETICGMACRIPLESVQAVLDEIGRTETLMPFIDPTGYMKIRNKLPEHERAVRAFATFRHELEKLRPTVAAGRA